MTSPAALPGQGTISHSQETGAREETVCKLLVANVPFLPGFGGIVVADEPPVGLGCFLTKSGLFSEVWEFPEDCSPYTFQGTCPRA